MTQRAGRGAAPEPGLRQCVDHEIGRHARLDRPAHHFPVEQIEHHGQVQPALVGPDVSDVRAEHLVRPGRRELAIQQIRRDRQLVLRVGCHPVAALVPGPDAVFTHQPFHAFLGDRPLIGWSAPPAVA